MKASDLSTYSLGELTDVLRVLKNYKVSLRQIGDRAELSDPKNPEPAKLKIEYAVGFSMDTVRSFARSAVTRYFPEALFDDKATFQENPNITG